MAIPLPQGPSALKTLTDLTRENDLPPEQASERIWRRELSISGRNWNKLYPYELIVVERQGDGSYAQKRAQLGTWKFTLPLPPESVSIDMPFAINVTSTLGGTVEEHNGAPFRTISLSGTTGVLLDRDDGSTSRPFSFLESVFSGTIAQAKNTKTAFNSIATAFSGGNPNTIQDSRFGDPEDLAELTGYYQFRLLQYFFEAYSELKRSKAGRTACLAFAMHKDESVYLVAPIEYQTRKSVPNPLEYTYHIQLKAWKRVRLTTGSAEIIQEYTPITKDPSKLAKLLATIEAARRVLQSARQTIIAVGGDVQASLFTPLREVCLFAKDALSVPLAVADLSDTVIKSTRRAIIALKATGNSITTYPSTLAITATREANEIEAAMNDLAGEQGDDPKIQDSRDAHPANSPFENPSENYEFFSAIQVGRLRLPPAVSAAIGSERNRVKTFTRLDFQTRRDAIIATATNFSNVIGIGSSTFNSTYSIATPSSIAVSTPTDEDYDVLYALGNVVTEMNRLVAVGSDNDPHAKLDAIAAVAGLATKSGIAFSVPQSKYSVPFPYGSTLEMLSLRYLGTPDRWIEIAALNGLQTPYVDEVGFTVSILTNGSDNRLNVQTNPHLYTGQPVWISSGSVARIRRRIVGINVISSASTLITLDGDANMNQFTTLAGAHVQAFLPNTVNSQQTIYIPSDVEPKTGDFKTKSIPGVSEFEKLIAVGGVDLLLTPTNDLVVTPDGDSRWAIGLTNIIQQIHIVLNCRTGTLLHHPEYGFPLEPGESVADLSASDVVAKCRGMFAGNPSFSTVAAQMNLAGPVAHISLAVAIAGTNQVIPISAEIAK